MTILERLKLVMASSAKYIQQLLVSEVIPIIAAASKKRLVVSGQSQNSDMYSVC